MSSPLRDCLLDRQLEEIAGRYGEHGLHFVDRRQLVTYPELLHRVRRCAAALRAAGLRPGDHVGLLLPTGPELYIALIGAQRAGVVPSPFAPPASIGRVADDTRAYQRALRAGSCRALVIDAAMQQRMGAALEQLEVPILQIERLEAAAPTADELAAAAAPPDADRLALVQYSSGSTSHPKGIALTHAQLAAGIGVVIEAAQLTAADVNGQWLPMHHDMGLIGSLAGLCVGIHQHIWSPFTFVRDPGRWLAQFAARRASIYAGPSFSYDEMAARCDDEQLATLDLSAWRVAFNGAEPVDPQALRRFHARFGPRGLRPDVVKPVYGLAEITLAATIPGPGSAWRARRVDGARLGPGAVVAAVSEGGREVVAVGPVVPGHRLRIRHGGETLAEERVGEIQLQGPAVMTGYYHDPAATAEAFEGAWLRTGDLGFVAGGELYVTGRSKEMMILHGRNYYPQDVEGVVQELPGCHRRMAVAFASADAEGEHIVAVIETRLAEAAACEALARAAQRAVRAAHSIPRLEVLLVRPGAVPRTTSGKRQRLLVKTTVEQGGFHDAVVWSTRPAPAPDSSPSSPGASHE